MAPVVSEVFADFPSALQMKRLIAHQTVNLLSFFFCDFTVNHFPHQKCILKSLANFSKI